MKSDHTYLDGSNYDDKDKDTSTIDTEDEANKLFRYSDQTWLQPHVDKYLQDALVHSLKSPRMFLFASH